MNINQIKYLAVISMLCDHIAYAFLPSSSTLYMVMRLFGRIAAPSMCFVLAQGFIHTSNRKKYFIRLIGFAIISQLPFSYFGFGSYTGPMGNVIFTLACAFAIMAVIEFKDYRQNTRSSRCCIAFIPLNAIRLDNTSTDVHSIHLFQQR